MTARPASSRQGVGARVFYLRGRVTCPLASIGARPADESNRLVVDDPETQVTIEPGTITLRDDRECSTKTVIADLVWLAEGPESFTIHIEVFKTGHTWSIDLHTHEPVPLTDRRRARYEPFAIIGIDRGKHEVLVDRERLAGAVEHVPFTRRLSGALTTTRDHLALATSSIVFDRSIGIGAFGRGMFLIRARLVRLDDSRLDATPPRLDVTTPRLDATTSRLDATTPRHETAATTLLDAAAKHRGLPLTTMLSVGAWELSLEALTDRWLPELVARDLLLFGLADLPLLAPLRAGRLRRGQTLAFRSTGEVRLDDDTAAFPRALEVAREYLEFHMLGGIIAAAFR
jgi:hypothetical protein